jgi:hypothetical protein
LGYFPDHLKVAARTDQRTKRNPGEQRSIAQEEVTICSGTRQAVERSGARCTKIVGRSRAAAFVHHLDGYAVYTQPATASKIDLELWKSLGTIVAKEGV